MTTFEQMEAAVEAATAGEWRVENTGDPEGWLSLFAGDNPDPLAFVPDSDEDMIAAAAALNWLRGGGMASYVQMREALRGLETAASTVNRMGATTGPHWSSFGAAIIKARAALAATEEAK
jgi:hypothetical protein